MSEQYYVDLAGKTAGPFSLEEVKGLYAAQSITDATLFCKPNSQEWLPISMIAGLLKPANQPASPLVVAFKPVEVAQREREVYRGDSICTVCGHVGKARIETKGSFAIEVVAWLFFLIPGVIYSLWRLTTRHKACRSCKSGAVIPVDSPQGLRLLQQ
jgi:hypothetical protein